MERTKKEIDMDYEKKYKEALKDMRVIYPNLKGDAKLAAEHAFPELKESEDERMIKAIEHILYENYSDAAVIEGVEIAEIVTWLDNQKEPIDPFDTKLFQDGVKEGRRLEREDMEKEQKPSTEETELNSIAFLEQLGYTCVPPGAEQKPADDEAKAIAYREYERGRESGLRDGQKYVLDNAESYGLCKPAEWSDEDEKTRRNLMSLLANMRGDRITEETYQKYYPWLKSHCTAKDCSSCAKHLEGYISGRSDAENKLLEQFGALVTPEGELHIKPRWKPSEEQMEALSDAYVEASTFKKGDILESLYNDLKKLM